MGRRNKNSGASKTRKNKTKQQRPPTIKPLSRYRVSYDGGDTWSPWVCSALQRKRVKISDGSIKWLVLASSKDTKKLAKLSREAFDVWNRQRHQPA